jgi:UDP-N-acetylmuramyl tripeptide synthase
MISGGIGRLRLMAAVAAAKGMSLAIRVSRRGGGTATPGLVADRIDPNLIARVTATLPDGVVIVAGTNGKTTTSRLVASLLDAGGKRVVHNRSGSNLVRGVATVLALESSVSGKIPADIAVIESDEAAFPQLVSLTKPRMVVLTNLFRDQLDRYGELATIANLWAPALATLDPEASIVLTGDDPGLVAVAADSPARKIHVSVDPGDYALTELPHAADSATCRVCGSDLAYTALTISHLGDWYCPACSRKRPEPDALATDVRLDGVDAAEATLRFRDEPPLDLRIQIPGLYSVYNLAVAATAARELGVPASAIARAVGEFSTPFGRLERFTVNGRNITLALVKNPVAFNETLRMLAGGPEGLSLPTLIAINDLDADGRDVSWLWDVDFEILSSGESVVSTTGIRAADMANRLKYAGLDIGRIRLLSQDLRAGLHAFVESVPEGERGFVLATYTAMLGLRQVLVDDGVARAYWEE